VDIGVEHDWHDVRGAELLVADHSGQRRGGARSMAWVMSMDRAQYQRESSYPVPDLNSQIGVADLTVFLTARCASYHASGRSLRHTFATHSAKRGTSVKGLFTNEGVARGSGRGWRGRRVGACGGVEVFRGWEFRHCPPS
jgi:hypothetical protein